MEPVDPSKKHFYISMCKSIVRFVAGGLLFWAGYILWIANNYTDIFIADSGMMMMGAGIAFILAEVLGIIEEL